VAGFGAAFVVAGAIVGLATCFGASFAVSFGDAAIGAGVAALFTALFTAPFVAVGFFTAGFGSTVALKMRERRPFFSATGGHKLHKICNTAAVAPLVVIPSDHFGEVVAKEHGARRINDC